MHFWFNDRKKSINKSMIFSAGKQMRKLSLFIAKLAQNIHQQFSSISALKFAITVEDSKTDRKFMATFLKFSSSELELTQPWIALLW